VFRTTSAAAAKIKNNANCSTCNNSEGGMRKGEGRDLNYFIQFVSNATTWVGRRKTRHATCCNNAQNKVKTFSSKCLFICM